MSSIADNETPHCLPSRFNLRHLFYMVGLVAVGLALHPGTIFASALLLFAWWSTLGDWKATLSVGKWLLSASAAMLVVWWMLASAVQVRGGYGHGVCYCQNNVKQMMLAMLNYESVNHELPRSTFVSRSGVPYSWRVAMLPYLDLDPLHSQYNFDEPWDSPANNKLLANTPPAFRCSFQDCEGGLTPYKLVVGPETAFDKIGHPTQVTEIADGSCNTIGIVEDQTRMVPWTKPEDLTINQALTVLNDPPPHQNLHERTTSFTKYVPSVNLAFLDGATTLYLPRRNMPVARSMFTHAGWEVDNWRMKLEKEGFQLGRPRIDRCLLVLLYPIVAMLPAIIAYFRKSD